VHRGCAAADASRPVTKGCLIPIALDGLLHGRIVRTVGPSDESHRLSGVLFDFKFAVERLEIGERDDVIALLLKVIDTVARTEASSH
jgi:hypothetical protein